MSRRRDRAGKQTAPTTRDQTAGPRWRLRIVSAVVAAIAVAGAVVAVACERPPERSLEAFCAAMTDAQDLDDTLATLDAEQLGPDVDALRRAARVAPEEIAPDVESVLALTQVLQETIATSPTGKADALEQALRDHAAELVAVDAAGQRLEAYTSTNCAIPLGSSVITQPTTTVEAPTPSDG